MWSYRRALVALALIVLLLLVGETNASAILGVTYVTCIVVAVIWLLWRRDVDR